MIPAILKNMNLALEGQGYLGKVEELVAPKFVLKMEEYRGGGMDLPVEIEMGQEAMTSEWTMAGVEPEMIALAGTHTERLVFRGAYQDNDGNVKAVKIQQSGRIKEVDMGTWKAGEKAGNKFACALTYYELVIDGKQLIEVDAENMIRRVNGVDQLAAQRAAIQV